MNRKKKDECADGCARNCQHDTNTKTFPTHTPGPWRVAEIRSVSITIETVATQHVNSMDAMTGRDLSGQRAELIARVIRSVDGDPKSSEANARLIAAAPDLLRIATEMHGENMYLEQDGNMDHAHAMKAHHAEEPKCEYCRIIASAGGR